jgi:transposase
MLTQSQRATILELHAKKMNKREIAKLLNLSRQSVRKVLQANSTAVPKIEREEKATPYRQQILELLHTCKVNLVRVHEELIVDSATLSYQALTAFCRRQGIGQEPILPAGRYHFEPCIEMQHDTSPHEVTVAGRKCKAQTASAVLCYSRLLFFQLQPTFQRFDCRVFLTEALRYMNGAPQRTMIDNTHVVVLRASSARSTSSKTTFSPAGPSPVGRISTRKRASGATASMELTRSIYALSRANSTRLSDCI